MSMKELMAAGNSLASGDTPEGVSFDGTNDYLSRSSDLSGNTDGKTFTFSAWVYKPNAGLYLYTTSNGTVFGMSIEVGSNERVSINLKDSSGSVILGTYNTLSANATPNNTWFHLLISLDTATQTFTVYLNDTALTGWTTTWVSTADINFTGTDHDIAQYMTGSVKSKCRLAHVFLDYTYRDLSTESNRRLFIDSDGKPSDTIPSNPILYLPMTDAATAGSNSGTGGDFTVNGVLETAGRGPNQYNCAASEFDGSADYLSRSSIAGISDGKEFTFSCAFRGDALDNKPFISIEGGGNQYFFIRVSNGGSYKYLTMGAYNTSTTYILHYNATDIKMYNGVNYSLQISIDMTDEAKSKVVVNGEVKTLSAFTAFSNENIDFTHSNYGIGAVPFPNHYFNGSIGELYFDDSYTDLSTDNPFWDADANRPKPVRQVISETGTTPLIALPIRGYDAGNNLGGGGDFAVNSGPYTGARGGSEYWARSASLGSEYLSSTTSISNTTTLTMVFSFKTSYTGGISLFSNLVGANYHANIGYRQGTGSPGSTMFSFRDSSHNDCVQFSIPDSSLAGIGKWNTIMFSVDSSNSSLYKVYVNGVAPSLSDVVASGASMKFSSATTYFSYYYGIQTSYDIGSLYFNTSYIDFSQESNRNLFVDQLGYPKDLTPAIDAGDITDPRIYMKFDDISALGTNSGTGGNFTVNSTAIHGADVDPNA